MKTEQIKLHIEELSILIEHKATAHSWMCLCVYDVCIKNKLVNCIPLCAILHEVFEKINPSVQICMCMIMDCWYIIDFCCWYTGTQNSIYYLLKHFSCSFRISFFFLPPLHHHHLLLLLLLQDKKRKPYTTRYSKCLRWQLK